MDRQWLTSLLGADPTQVMIILGALLSRLGAAVWITPFLGGRLVPASVKTSLILMLAVLLYPQVAPTVGNLAHASPLVLAGIMAKEGLVGAALGFVMAIIFWTAEASGRLVDIARGANLSEALVPQHGARTSPLGDLYFQLSLVMFIVLGGHHIFITALGTSFGMIPVTGFPTSLAIGGVASLTIGLTADLFLLALSLSAPVIAALFLADLTLGVLNRFTPQLNVFFVAMPAKALLGIAVLVLSVSVLLGALPPLLGQAVRTVSRALEILGRGI